VLPRLRTSRRLNVCPSSRARKKSPSLSTRLSCLSSHSVDDALCHWSERAELARLKITDTDRQRMIIDIQGGKGRKDRDVMAAAARFYAHPHLRISC